MVTASHITKLLGPLLLISVAAACASTPEAEPGEPFTEGVYQFRGEVRSVGRSEVCAVGGCTHAATTTRNWGFNLVAASAHMREDGTIHVTSNLGTCDPPSPDSWRSSATDRIYVNCRGVQLTLTSSGGSADLVRTREMTVRDRCVDYVRDVNGRPTATCATWDYQTVTRAQRARAQLSVAKVD